MLRKLMSLTTALTLGLAATSAHAEMIAKTSPYSFAETMDRLEAAVTAAGATVFARIDHAAGAKKVELELRPTQLLIFGNPKLGTPAMTDNQTAGLDLPLRVLAYADGEGVVHVTYHAPRHAGANTRAARRGEIHPDHDRRAGQANRQSHSSGVTVRRPLPYPPAHQG